MSPRRPRDCPALRVRAELQACRDKIMTDRKETWSISEQLPVVSDTPSDILRLEFKKAFREGISSGHR
jgi:hypothetical protein